MISQEEIKFNEVQKEGSKNEKSDPVPDENIKKAESTHLELEGQDKINPRSEINDEEVNPDKN